jgi:hypothetical protein
LQGAEGRLRDGDVSARPVVAPVHSHCVPLPGRILRFVTGLSDVRQSRTFYSPHIGTGSENARTPVLMLVQDLHVRILNAATGELTIDPDRDYQPLGRPPGPQPKTPRTR